MKKRCLQKFPKIHRKTLCQSHRPATLLKKRLWHRCFPVNFVKVLRTPFYRTPLGNCFWKGLDGNILLKQYSENELNDARTNFVYIKVITGLVVITRLRSSLPEVFLWKSVMKNCSKFTGEHSCRSVISTKLRCKFIEITLRHGCSPEICCIFTEYLFLRTPLEGCFCIGWTSVDRDLVAQQTMCT